MFHHILVYKLFTSNRLDLPILSDRVLLAKSPYFRMETSSQGNTSLSNAASSYLTNITGKAQSLFRGKPHKPAKQDREESASFALDCLIAWDTSASLKQRRAQKQETLFLDSLCDEEIMLDLSISSKLDALLKMIADQINSQVQDEYFPQTLQPYAKRSVAQYVDVLWVYYEVAFEDMNKTPLSPELDFSVQTFFQNE